MAHCNKKSKYNNGGLVARKEFKGIGSIEGNVSGNSGYRAGSVSASTNVGGTRVTASRFKDSMGNAGNSYSLEKQLPGKSSVGLKVRKDPKIEYNKQIKGGFNLKVTAGKNSGAMSISKPL